MLRILRRRPARPRAPRRALIRRRRIRRKAKASLPTSSILKPKSNVVLSRARLCDPTAGCARADDCRWPATLHRHFSEAICRRHRPSLAASLSHRHLLGRRRRPMT